MLSSTLVLAIVVVGGVTRLTESGLSITEWKPITGILPPLSDEDWTVEFDKYKQTPEFKLYVDCSLVARFIDTSKASTLTLPCPTSNESFTWNGAIVSSAV